MKASETKVQKILEGTNQYVVPLFQRRYSWNKKQWDVLWNDLIEVYGEETERDHFMGSIVTAPTSSVPEGVSQFLLIDGQQRLTTFLLLLAAIRDVAQKEKAGSLGPEIEETLLCNKFKDGNDKFKLLPTHADRDSFIKIIKGGGQDGDEPISVAYRFFRQKLTKGGENGIPLDLRKLTGTLISSLSLVSIVLHREDNPHLIFESLNAKGLALTQADLLRNYFFMRLHVDQQESLYHDYWKPMQEQLGESLTECIRHFLMKDGEMVKQGDVYIALKERADGRNKDEVLNDLKELATFAGYYSKMTHPERESDRQIAERMRRLNRIEVTTAYPLILNVYHDYSTGKITHADLLAVLETIENFMMRRWICGVPTYTLNKLFPVSYAQALEHGSLVNGLRAVLAKKNYPGDVEFKDRLATAPLYAPGERLQKTTLLLERLESSFNHYETVSSDKITIEHVMPQTLTPWWREHLGEECDDTYETLLHTLGNLTLTGYNQALTNDDFPAKQKILQQSHIELNKYFTGLKRWDGDGIKQRGMELAKSALVIWPFFGFGRPADQGSDDVTGRTPVSLAVLGEQFTVKTWRDVVERTVETIAMFDSDAFEKLVEGFPTFLGKDPANFRAHRKLKNGYFLLTHYSAKAAYQFCQRAVEAAGLQQEDWRVKYSD
jgi:uncharacterized protein with ParB-like and HNH nuclease domain